MSYLPLKGNESFSSIFKNPDLVSDSDHFRIYISKNEIGFALGMILPKKNIKLAVHRNYIKRTVRSVSDEYVKNLKISLVFLSKKKIKLFKKNVLRFEIDNILSNVESKIK